MATAGAMQNTSFTSSGSAVIRCRVIVLPASAGSSSVRELPGWLQVLFS